MRKIKVWAIAVTALAAATLGTACGDDGAADGEGGGSSGSAGGVCADVACDSVPSFTDPSLAWDKCTSCHAADATTRTANGVPDDSDYTTHAGVSSRGEEIANRVNGVGNIMPPSSPALSDAEKQAFTTWGCCGAPQ